MGLSVKKIHGKEFLYYQEHGKSILIGPKGEYDKGNLDKINYALTHNDSRIIKLLDKYVEETLELSLYMPEPERKEYLSKRSAELLARLRRLDKEIKTSTKEISLSHYKKQKLTKQNLKVLLVNADTTNNHLLSKYMRNEGQRCDVSDSPRNAISLAIDAFVHKKKYDLIFIDFALFKNSSLHVADFLEKIDRTEKQKIVLLVDSPINKKTSKRLQQMNIQDVIQKPVQLDDKNLNILNQKIIQFLQPQDNM